jgi:hypothetical protein
VIEYLAAKYLDSDTNRHQRVVRQTELLLTELTKLMPQLKAGGGA